MLSGEIAAENGSRAVTHGPAARRRGRFGRPRRRLRAGLVQLLFTVAGLGLGLFSVTAVLAIGNDPDLAYVAKVLSLY